MTSAKWSSMWDHFDISPSDPSQAICKHCSESVSRVGKASSSWTTMMLKNHMLRDHRSIKLTVSAAAKKPKKLQAQSSAAPECRVSDFNNLRSMKIHRLIAQMIAVDNQPFSIVNSEGFRALMRVVEPRYKLPSESYLRQVAVPELFRALKTKVAAVVDDVQHISLTTDTWTSSICSESLMSLTGHWLDDDFTRRSAILQTSHMPGPHTAADIQTKFKDVVKDWNLSGKVHTVVRDDAENVTKALDVAGVDSVGCLAHMLQLSVKAGLESQRALDDTVAICRKIATHFRHSTLAKERLAEIQRADSDKKSPVVQQDAGQTCWNSTFCVVQRLIEQKKAVIAYWAEHDLLAALTKHQWELMDRLVAVLEPFEKITPQISSDDATLADVIPVVTALQMTLEQHDNDSGVQTMKSVLLSNIKDRFADMYDQPLFVVATVVDPRYKLKFFSEAQQQSATELLIAEVRRIAVLAATEGTSNGELPTTKKRPRLEAASKVSGVMQEIVSRGAHTGGAETTVSDKAEDQVWLYLAQPNIPLSESPTVWWRDNWRLYPQVAAVARRFLSAPATSVPNERLFSSADRQNLLLPDCAGMLLFIRQNIKFD